MFDYDICGEIKVFEVTLPAGTVCLYPDTRIHESLLYITEGSLLFEDKGEKTIIKKGQIAYIARGGGYDRMSAYICDSVTYISTNFNYKEGPTEGVLSLPFNILCSEGSSRYETLFLKLLNTCSLKLPAYMVNAKSLILEIVGKLYNEHTLSGSQMKKFNEIKIGIDYIKCNFKNSDLKVSDIAKICNMSERNLRRHFMICYNKTPFAFLQEYRVNQAEILLSNTQSSISEIASSCGFSDIYSFSHCFKIHNGVSPSDYRKTYKK